MDDKLGLGLGLGIGLIVVLISLLTIWAGVRRNEALKRAMRGIWKSWGQGPAVPEK